jgi:benzylsuccinate CoA-transferase BbsF subunit
MDRSVLNGLKVADFTGAIAGPLATRILAAEGATVVKVECHKYPEPVRNVVPYKDEIPGFDRSTQFAFYNFGKYSITVDMDKPAGQEIGRRLVRWADVLMENMAPGSMVRWGLDYEHCRQLKPDIIYLSSSSLGRAGPLSSYAAWGYHHGPLAGFAHVTGWPDRLPCRDAIAYTDSVAPGFSVIALIGAFLYRHRTGKGVYIDQSQTEAGLYFLGPAILDYLANGRIATRQGNRDPNLVPHGIFPCRSEDRWVAIGVSNEEEWREFCHALNQEEWLQDERFANVIARKKHEDELERLVSEWTQQRTPEEVMKLLQSVGVPAGIVATTEDLFDDPQVRHRGHFQKLEHKLIGPYSYELPSFRFSEIEPQPQRPAPLLGEHNEYVLKNILGYTDEDIAQLLIEGAITTEADLPELGSL